MSVPSPFADDPPASPEKFTFTGTGSEYFRIWIVNLLLTLATLGIYSAWAKVRKLRYFYGSTRVAGSSFEYHGAPLAILKGRLVATALLILYTIVSEFSITANLVMLALLALALPWLLWRSLQFKLYNSSYRGIRFGFRGRATQAYWAFLGLPLIASVFFIYWAASSSLLLVTLTLFAFAPLIHHRIKRFQHTESRFGTIHFSFDAGAADFYKAYLLAMLALIAVCLAVAVLFGVLLGVGPFGGSVPLTPLIVIFFIASVYLGLLLLLPLFLTLIQNLIWNTTRLQEHRFTCNMTWGRTAFIMATNLLGIIATLGLFTPFAQIRMMKYRMESMTLIPASSLDDFVAGAQADPSASGEGMADLLDFDLSL